MNKPTVEEIIEGLTTANPEFEVKPNRYAAVMVTARRARQINNYYRSLGEGGAFEDVAPPLVTSGSRNYLTIAMEEVSKSEIGFRLRTEG